jgi:cytochrome c oxidase subunit IV
MAEAHLANEAHDHTESHVSLYMKVFVTLLIFTIAEYAYATWARVGFGTLVFGLMAMAITKAALVGAYFMHLKFEGKWVYVMLVPAGVLATVLVLALCPDIASRDSTTPTEPADDEASIAAPRHFELAVTAATH